MDNQAIEKLIEHYQNKYGPLITLQQAADIRGHQLQTVYDHSSQGRFDAFKRRGRPVLLELDAYIRHLFGDSDEA
ncbi:MAG: hypothetical protein GC159_10950 [Phycisphaera sp.]|nr:hypothetical protein [Phycisphaera sp.]